MHVTTCSCYVRVARNVNAACSSAASKRCCSASPLRQHLPGSSLWHARSLSLICRRCVSQCGSRTCARRTKQHVRNASSRVTSRVTQCCVRTRSVRVTCTVERASNARVTRRRQVNSNEQQGAAWHHACRVRPETHRCGAARTVERRCGSPSRSYGPHSEVQVRVVLRKHSTRTQRDHCERRVQCHNRREADVNDAVGLELVEESCVAVSVLVAGVSDQEDVAKAATACVWARCGFR